MNTITEWFYQCGCGRRGGPYKYKGDAHFGARVHRQSYGGRIIKCDKRYEVESSTREI